MSISCGMYSMFYILSELHSVYAWLISLFEILFYQHGHICYKEPPLII